MENYMSVDEAQRVMEEVILRYRAISSTVTLPTSMMANATGFFVAELGLNSALSFFARERPKGDLTLTKTEVLACALEFCNLVTKQAYETLQATLAEADITDMLKTAHAHHETIDQGAPPKGLRN